MHKNDDVFICIYSSFSDHKKGCENPPVDYWGQRDSGELCVVDSVLCL